jgi:hypothetical protein
LPGKGKDFKRKESNNFQGGRSLIMTSRNIKFVAIDGMIKGPRKGTLCSNFNPACQLYRQMAGSKQRHAGLITELNTIIY